MTKHRYGPGLLDRIRARLRAFRAWIRMAFTVLLARDGWWVRVDYAPDSYLVAHFGAGDEAERFKTHAACFCLVEPDEEE